MRKKEINEINNELRETEKQNRDTLDKTIFSLSSIFLGFILGFFKDIATYVNYSYALKIGFLLMALFLIVTIILGLLSLHYSEKASRNAQYSTEDPTANRMQNVISGLNLSYLLTFIAALIMAFILLTTNLFFNSSNIQFKTQNSQTLIKVNYND